MASSENKIKEENYDNIVIDIDQLQRPFEHAQDNETDILNEIFRQVRKLPSGPAKAELSRSCCRASSQVIQKIFAKKLS